MEETTKQVSKKQISSNMIANIVSYSANLLVAFILTPFLINNLGKDIYSFYPMANTIVSYMSVLMNSMNSMASRFVTVSLVQKKDEEANRYFSSTLAANVIMSLCLLIPMLIIVVFLDKLMKVPINAVASIKLLFALIFSSSLINIAAAVFGIATFAKNRIDLRSVRELITAVLKLVLFYVFYKYMTPSIIYVGIVTLIVAIVNIIFQYNYTKYLLPEVKISWMNISWIHIKELLSSSCWNAINTFGNILLAGMSLILGNILFGAMEGGSFSIVNTVPQFINGCVCMLIGIFYPVITYKYAQEDKIGLMKEINISQNIVGALGCAIMSIFTALAVEFFTLWTPTENANFLSILSFATIFPHFIIACMWTLTNLNIVMNKVKIPAIYTLVNGVANVLISIIVWKLFKPSIIVLPIISGILQCIWIGIFIPLYVSKNLKVKRTQFYGPLIRNLICSSLTIVIVSHLKHFFVLNSWFKLISFGMITGMGSLIVFIFVVFGGKNNRNC